MFKVDVHTHILPKRWPDLEKRYGYGGWPRFETQADGSEAMMVDCKHFRTFQPNAWNPDVRLHDCDHDGVRVQVLSTVPILFSYWAKPDDGLDFSRYLNDHIAETAAAHPTRFVGLATVPLQSPELAIRELERAVKELGLAGVEIGTHVNDWNLNEPALFPFFEAAAELGAAVFVHPWDMMGRDRMPQYWLPWLVGMPAETSRAICSMIFGGVFERLPALRVNFAHGGGSFPATIGRIEHGFTVRPDLVAVDNPVSPRAYLGRFYLDSLVHDPLMLRYIVDLVGESRVTLGSDYPFPLGEHRPGTLIESMDDFSDRVKRMLLGENALAWLGLRPEQFLP
ncbi:MAG: amidohydrolase family protein [Bacteroidota bacterium]|jgi:aminocarboxymuconate-semialdehyde decarboxylase|nr:amidohydrolase family protein [Bacteroidota bacterium]